MIPKIHHVVWTSENPFMEKYFRYRLSWMYKNPDWSFYFWTMNKVKDIECDIVSQVMKSQAHWTLKSDVLRFYLLYEFGGVYSDTDIECLKSMNCFLSDRAFCGFSPTPGLAMNAVFGGEPGYKLFLKIAIEQAEKILENVVRANENVCDYSVNIAGKMLLQCDRVYPQHFFSPFGNHNEQYRENVDLEKRFPDSYCVHHWTGQDPDGWNSRRGER